MRLGNLVSLATACAAFAGCGNPGTIVAVQVDDASITSVELFVGRDGCTEDSGKPCALAPPGVPAHLRVGQAGGAYLRDTYAPFPAKVHGGSVKFRLVAPAGYTPAVQIVAVGYDASGNPVATAVARDLSVETDGTLVVPITLAAAAPLDAKEEAAQTPGDFVAVWNNVGCDPQHGTCPPPSDCVVAEHREAGGGTSAVRRVVIVPDGDEDCDGIPTLDPNNTSQSAPNPLECDWLYPQFQGAASGDISCATTTTATTGKSSCVLAGGACRDGIGLDGSLCLPITSPQYCLPDKVCPMPCAKPGGGALDKCFASDPTVQAMPQFECTVQYGDAGKPCTGDSLTADADASGLLLNSTAVCMDALLARDDLAMFSPSGQVQLGAATFSAQFTQAPCDFAITWDGVLPANSTNLPPQWLLADLVVDDQHHMVVPIHFTFNQIVCGTTTGNAMTCVPLNLTDASTTGDGIVNCAP